MDVLIEEPGRRRGDPLPGLVGWNYAAERRRIVGLLVAVARTFHVPNSPLWVGNSVARSTPVKVVVLSGIFENRSPTMLVMVAVPAGAVAAACGGVAPEGGRGGAGSQRRQRV